jgi:hypothetical protein
MGDVFVSNGDSAEETAILLLAAAEALELPYDHVRAQGGGGFMVDSKVADKAGVDYEGKPAKKAAAKKSSK